MKRLHFGYDVDNIFGVLECSTCDEVVSPWGLVGLGYNATCELAECKVDAV